MKYIKDKSKIKDGMIIWMNNGDNYYKVGKKLVKVMIISSDTIQFEDLKEEDIRAIFNYKGIALHEKETTNEEIH